MLPQTSKQDTDSLTSCFWKFVKGTLQKPMTYEIYEMIAPDTTHSCMENSIYFVNPSLNNCNIHGGLSVFVEILEITACSVWYTICSDLTIENLGQPWCV